MQVSMNECSRSPKPGRSSTPKKPKARSIQMIPSTSIIHPPLNMSDACVVYLQGTVCAHFNMHWI